MKLGTNWRIGAEFGHDYTADYVTVVGEADNSTYANPITTRLFMSPNQARQMARKLKQAADAVDPPKRRSR